MPSIVSFVAGTAATLTYGSTIGATAPSSINNNDGLYAFIASRSNSVSIAPSGWTLVTSQSQSYDYTVRLYFYKKDTVTTADSNTTFTWTMNYSDYNSITMAVVRTSSGISPKIDELVVKAVSNSSGDYPVIPTAAVTNYGGERELVLFVAAQSQIYNTYTAPITPDNSAQWTQVTTDNSTYNRLVGSYLELETGRGTTGAKFYLSTSNYSTYHSLVGFTIKFRETTRGAGYAETLNFSETQNMSGSKFGGIASSQLNLRTYMTDGEFFIDYLADTVGTNDSALFIQPAYIEILQDIISCVPNLVGDRVKTASADSAFSLQDESTFAARLAKQLVDTLYVADATPATAKFSQALVDALRIIDALRAGRPATVSETIGLARTLSVVTAATLADRLGLARSILPATKFGTTLSDQIRFADALRKFFSGEAIDTVSFAPTAIAKTNYPKLLTDTVGVQETVGPQLVLRVIAPEVIGFDDAQALSLLFSPELLDEVQFAAAYLDPTGGFTTWAINTRSGATTEYTNYNFNSFAKGGNKYLAASQDGLYELNGDDDDNAAIIATIRSGLMQLGNSRFTAFKDVYIGMRGNGNFVLRMVTGSGQTYNYNVVASSLRSTKVPLGKGLRARYFAFELINSGQDFDLDSVEFLPLVSHRRV